MTDAGDMAALFCLPAGPRFLRADRLERLAREAYRRGRGGPFAIDPAWTSLAGVPGDAMDAVIPSSTGETFDVEWQVTEDGELRNAVLTGAFYPNAEEMTYTVDFSDYGTEKDITAP